MAKVTTISREHSIVRDEYGVDPLLDRTYADIVNIPTYTLYNVTQEERGRPDLISYNSYRTSNLWWVILLYNGLFSYKDVVEGRVLRIPTSGQIIKYLTKSSQTSTTVKTFVI